MGETVFPLKKDGYDDGSLEKNLEEVGVGDTKWKEANRKRNPIALVLSQTKNERQEVAQEEESGTDHESARYQKEGEMMGDQIDDMKYLLLDRCRNSKKQKSYSGLRIRNRVLALIRYIGERNAEEKAKAKEKEKRMRDQLAQDTLAPERIETERDRRERLRQERLRQVATKREIIEEEVEDEVAEEEQQDAEHNGNEEDADSVDTTKDDDDNESVDQTTRAERKLMRRYAAIVDDMLSKRTFRHGVPLQDLEVALMQLTSYPRKDLSIWLDLFEERWVNSRVMANRELKNQAKDLITVGTQEPENRGTQEPETRDFSFMPTGSQSTGNVLSSGRQKSNNSLPKSTAMAIHALSTSGPSDSLDNVETQILRSEDEVHNDVRQAVKWFRLSMALVGGFSIMRVQTLMDTSNPQAVKQFEDLQKLLEMQREWREEEERKCVQATHELNALQFQLKQMKQDYEDLKTSSSRASTSWRGSLRSAARGSRY